MSKVEDKALQNYTNKTPWPNKDKWHAVTVDIILKSVDKFSNKYISDDSTVLIVGCGTRKYNLNAKRVIYLDIVEKYAKQFPDHLICSAEVIKLPDSSIDVIICVGTVLNYTHADKVFKEFNRILRDDGYILLEYERADSSEFFFTKDYAKPFFISAQEYNGQEHLLRLYSESYLETLCTKYSLSILSRHRFHCLSAFLLRLKINSDFASYFHYLDPLFFAVSKYVACNGILTIKKSPLS